MFFHNSLQALPHPHRCKRPSKLPNAMQVYRYSYWLVIFCTTNSSRLLARERWQTFENSWKECENSPYTFWVWSILYRLLFASIHSPVSPTVVYTCVLKVKFLSLLFLGAFVLTPDIIWNCTYFIHKQTWYFACLVKRERYIDIIKVSRLILLNWKIRAHIFMPLRGIVKLNICMYNMLEGLCLNLQN